MRRSIALLEVDCKGMRKMFTIKQYLEIDGHEHGMIIEGTNEDNPIVLFLHGGPGYSEYPMISREKLDWLQHVTVCYWDQRGAGMSYNRSTQGELSPERFVQDCVHVTLHLKQQWRKEKIYLFGHSWGSIVGSLVAHQYPEHYYAYIGTGQIGRYLESATDTVRFVKQNAQYREDKRALKRANKVVFDQELHTSRPLVQVLSYVNKYRGGMKRSGYSTWQGFVDVLRSKHYTDRQKFNVIPGSFQTYKEVGEFMVHADLAKLTPNFDLPIYILHGRHDFQTSILEAERFYELIEAPYKEFHVFEESAHSPFVEEKEQFVTVLQQIIHQTSA